MEHNLVVQSNSLVTASYKLTLDEKKIIVMAISKLQSKEEYPDDPIVTISAEEYSKVCGVNINTSYSRLIAAMNELYERSILFREDKSETKVRWLQEAGKHEKGSGCIKLHFSDRVSKHLLQLSETFTAYRLKNVARFKSVNSIRIYELLSQFDSSKDSNWYNPTVSELKKYLGIEDKYPIFSQFKRRILDPCVKEINIKSDLDVMWYPIKKGRAVVRLKFEFSKQDAP